MSEPTKKPWLSAQIEQTKKTLEEIPEWLRRLIRFEGSDVEHY